MEKRNKVYLFVIIILIISVSIYIYIEKFMPSNKMINRQEYYGIAENEVLIIHNNLLQDSHGIYYDDEVYLPYEWVLDNINDKFFFSPEESMLMYTLPDKIVYMHKEFILINGQKAFITVDGKAYLSVDLLREYSDINYKSFVANDIKKVYTDSTWKDLIVTKARKRAKLRVSDSVKSDVVSVIEEKDELHILNSEGDEWTRDKAWHKVCTANGDYGYVQKSVLSDLSFEQRVSRFVAPVYSGHPLGERVVLAWHQVTVKKANENINSLIKPEYAINVISPTWFSLTDNEGNYSSLADKLYVDIAHSKGLKVWILIDNFSKDVDTEQLLKLSSTRKKLISKLISDTLELGADGINLDFEYLKEAAMPYYIQFIRELSVHTRREGLTLSVDNPSYAVFNKYYARDKQAEVVDYVINMAYDEHYAGSDKGSVSSINFVRNGIEDTLKEVPAEKLINAIPVYTRLWTETSEGLGSEAIGIDVSLEWVKENNLTPIWLDESGQYYVELNESGKNSYMWLEEERSLALKLSVIDEHNLAGVAVWKLGLASDDIWSLIK